MGRAYHAYNPELLKNFLIEYDWSTFMNTLDPNECWNEILCAICIILDEMCPLKKKNVRDRNEPWLTNDIIDLIHNKDLAWKKARKTKSLDDINLAKNLRNCVKDTIPRAKANFFTFIF